MARIVSDLRLAVMLVLFVLANRTAAAQPADFGTPQAACEAAIISAERRYGIPPGLLQAIGRVESGRVDATGAVRPWPWTANAEGLGRKFDGRQQAVTWVGGLRAAGTNSVDVGCMQVNLHHHPNAFATLDEAFDPVGNVDYAARFLLRLRGPASAVLDELWWRATSAYHSATEQRGLLYRQRVEHAYRVLPTEAATAVRLGSGRVVSIRQTATQAALLSRQRAEAALAAAGVPRMGPDGDRLAALLRIAGVVQHHPGRRNDRL